jgi:hypothetical protein
VNHDLGVGIGVKSVAFTFKVFPDFLKVVNLTVECNPDGLIFVGHGLLPSRREIDHAQSLMAKPHRHCRGIQDNFAFIIGSAMSKGVPHTTQDRGVNRAWRKVSVNAAHGKLSWLLTTL